MLVNLADGQSGSYVSLCRHGGEHHRVQHHTGGLRGTLGRCESDREQGRGTGVTSRGQITVAVQTTPLPSSALSVTLVRFGQIRTCSE